MDKSYTLTKEQQCLVEQNISIVEIIIRKYINTNENVRGLEYEELYSVGCLALCHAASAYDGSVKFVTFASTVIKNRLIDQCRKAVREHSRSLSLDNTLADGDDDFNDVLSESNDDIDSIAAEDNANHIISEAKRKYKGAVLKGIEAIELRLKGYSGSEIADLYGVKNNNVTNWVSKAVVKLKKDFVI